MSRIKKSGEFGRILTGRDGVPEDLSDFLDTPFKVTVELGRTRMRIRELLALEPGTVVGLPQPAGEDLAVYASDVYLGVCRVLIQESKLAVRVTELIEER